MGDQKNLFLAIGLSIAIILFFQFIFPQPTPTSINESQKIKESQTITSTSSEDSLDDSIVIKPKEEIIGSGNRILINTPLLKGSINLTDHEIQASASKIKSIDRRYIDYIRMAHEIECGRQNQSLTQTNFGNRSFIAWTNIDT